MAKGVVIDLDQERVIRLDTNALCMAEDVRGIPVNQFGTGFRDIRTLLWAGLRHEIPDLSVAKAGELIDMGIEKHGREYVEDKVAKALILAMHVKKEDLPEEVQKKLEDESDLKN